MSYIAGLEDNVSQLSRYKGDRFDLMETPAVRLFVTELEAGIEGLLSESKFFQKHSIDVAASAEVGYAQTARYTVDLVVKVNLSLIQR